MKIEFLGPILRPEPQVVTAIEDDGHTLGTVADFLRELGYPDAQHRLIRVFADGRQLNPSEPFVSAEKISLMLTVGGG